MTQADESPRHDQVKFAHLSESEIFRDLTPNEMQEVARMSAMTTCHRGRVFYEPEQTGEVLFILKKGRVVLYRITEDGRKLVTGTVGAGSVFGEMSMLGQGMADAYAEALEDCTLCVLSREDISRLIGTYPSIAIRMLDRLAARLREAEDRLADVAYRPVQARVANTLLRLAGHDSEIHLSHQDLAEIVGTHRETVTRTLNHFRSEGAVELDRMLIRVVDATRLAEAGAETRETL